VLERRRTYKIQLISLVLDSRLLEHIELIDLLLKFFGTITESAARSVITETRRDFRRPAYIRKVLADNPECDGIDGDKGRENRRGSERKGPETVKTTASGPKSGTAERF